MLSVLVTNDFVEIQFVTNQVQYVINRVMDAGPDGRTDGRMDGWTVGSVMDTG